MYELSIAVNPVLIHALGPRCIAGREFAFPSIEHTCPHACETRINFLRHPEYLIKPSREKT